jgi:PAS domain S-box-containing protein
MRSGADRHRAIADLLELCEPAAELAEVAARALERVGAALHERGADGEIADAIEPLRGVRAGDWQLFEHHLRELGRRYSLAGVAVPAWFGVASAVFQAILARAVDRHAADPPRLTAVLRVLTEHVERALAAITGGYYAAKHERERDVALQRERLIDAALDAVIEIDDHGVVTELNPAAERMFGHARADAIGRPLADLIIPERLRERHRAGLARFVATGVAKLVGTRIELTAIRAGGSELLVELSLVVTHQLDGSRRFVGFLRDLDERSQAEESMALREHALEQAQFGIVVTDPGTRRITNVNPAYARMIGYSRSELIGTTGGQLVAPASLTAAAEISRVIDRRGHHTYELDLLHKDGRSVPVLASSSTARVPSGAEVRISTVVDMSERKQLEQARDDAEQALQRSAARLAVLASASHAFASAAGHVEELLELVARRLADVIGDGCAVRLITPIGAGIEPSFCFYHRDPAVRELVDRAATAEPQRSGTVLSDRIAASGEAVLIPVVDLEKFLPLVPPMFRPLLSRTGVASAMAIPLRAHGKTIGAVIMLRATAGNPYTIDDQHFAQDLADRAGLAIDNAVLVATLEQRVAERTRALEGANDDLEAFSASVSHDLRGPLRAIDGFSVAVLEDCQDVLDDHARNYLQRIRASARRMAGLIDDLLILARVSRVQLDLAAVDLSALAAEVVAELRQCEPARTTPVHIAPGLSAAAADPRLLRIVLDNLLGNAWKFTAKHPHAEIWFGGDGDTFHVRDTGAGFDMAHVEQLFVPFQRFHVAGDYDGTGIGLTIVHRIITHHRGRIWANAEVDRGATLFFTLGEARARTAGA